jgi:hypothetical protein
MAIGSCVASVREEVASAHPPNQRGHHPCGIDDGFMRGDIEMQVPLMDAAEGTPVGPQRRTSPFTGMAVHFASALAIILPRPLVGAEPCASSGDLLCDQGCTGACVHMVAHPEKVLTRVPRHHTYEGGTIIGRDPMPLLFSGAPPRRIAGVRMRRAVFPRLRVQFTCLNGRTGHHVGRGCLVQVGLKTPSSRMELFAEPAQLACKACGGLTLGNSMQQQHQGRRALPGFREDRPGQQRVVTISGSTAV